MRRPKGNDLAYAAGIIDGEGSIGFRGFGKRDKPFHAIWVRVSNTNEWLVKWLQFNFGGTVRKAKSLPQRKDMWLWTIRTRQALHFLELIVPYLKIKRPQAEIAIQFAKARNYGRKRTDEEIAVEQAQAILMRQYNKRGKHD